MPDLDDISISPEEYAMLEDYLDGNLSGEALMAFEAKLAQDPIWKYKLDEVKFLREGIEVSAMKAQIDLFHKEMKGSTKSSRSLFSLWPWAAAACFIVFLTAGVFLLGWFTSDSERLFEAYYEKDPGLIAVMSESENYEFERGMVDYKTEKYDEALELWMPLLDADPQNDTLQYFIGLSYLGVEDFTSSQELLQEVANNPNSQFQKDAAWYSGLMLVKQGEYEEAISFLRMSNRKEADDLILKIQELQ